MTIYQKGYLRWALGSFAVSLLLFLGAFGVLRADDITWADFKAIQKIVREVQEATRYVTDPVQYNMIDFAQDARVTGMGDCEDFAIAYRNAILERFPQYADQLKLVRMTSTPTSTHVALFFRYNSRAWVADGLGFHRDGSKYMPRVTLVRFSEYNPKRVIGEIRWDANGKAQTFNRGKRNFDKKWKG